MICYVDDFKMCGPKAQVQAMWNKMQEEQFVKGEKYKIVLDKPEKLGRFLGCDHEEFDAAITWYGQPLTTLGANAKT